jgi:hypothetical protein
MHKPPTMPKSKCHSVPDGRPWIVIMLGDDGYYNLSVPQTPRIQILQNWESGKTDESL